MSTKAIEIEVSLTAEGIKETQRIIERMKNCGNCNNSPKRNEHWFMTCPNTLEMHTVSICDKWTLKED